MNPKTSVPQTTVEWSAQEVRSMASAAYRDLAAERRAVGDVAAARELERLAETPEATLDAARDAWDAQFCQGRQEVPPSGLEIER